MTDQLDKFTQTFPERLLDHSKLYIIEKKFTFSDTNLKNILVIRNPSIIVETVSGDTSKEFTSYMNAVEKDA